MLDNCQRSLIIKLKCSAYKIILKEIINEFLRETYPKQLVKYTLLLDV